MQWLAQNEPVRAADVLGQKALRHEPVSNLACGHKGKVTTVLGCHSSETDADDGKKTGALLLQCVLVRNSYASKRPKLVTRFYAFSGTPKRFRAAVPKLKKRTKSCNLQHFSKFEKSYSNFQNQKHRSIIILINQTPSSFPEFWTPYFSQHQPVHAHEVL